MDLYNRRGQPFRPYQHAMVDQIIAVPKGCIWAFMGAGKTAAVLTAIDRMRLAGLISKPTLVISPLRVARDVWPVEVREWPHLDGLRVEPIIGTAGQRLMALSTPADIYVVNFENLEWLIAQCEKTWPFEMIVVDESTKLKSLRANIRTNSDGTAWVQGQGGVRAKALLRATFSTKTTRFIELTGTPAPNGLQDLWGQTFFLDHGKRLGRNFDAFRNRWFRIGFNGTGMEPLPFAQAQIENQMKDIALSLKAEDWFDLSQPIVTTINIDLPPDARAKYREMEKQLFTEIQGHSIEAFNAGSRTQKCLQMAAGAAYLGHADDPGERKWVETHTAKLDALEDIAEEANGMPILVAYNFKSDLARLKKRFPLGRELDQKSQTLKEWNDGKIPLLFTHPASAGHGLNLQHGSNILVYFTLDWNYENHAQILERIGPVRQAQSGYKRNVYVYRIVARKTVDEDVLDSLETKCSVQEALLNGMRKRLTSS